MAFTSLLFVKWVHLSTIDSRRASARSIGYDAAYAPLDPLASQTYTKVTVRGASRKNVLVSVRSSGPVRTLPARDVRGGGGYPPADWSSNQTRRSGQIGARAMAMRIQI